MFIAYFTTFKMIRLVVEMSQCYGWEDDEENCRKQKWK